MINDTRDRVGVEFLPGLYQAGLKTVAPWTEGICSDLALLVRAMHRATGIPTKYVVVGATPSVSVAARAVEVLIGRITDDIVSRNKWLPQATFVLTTPRGCPDDLATECDDPVAEHASDEEAAVIQVGNAEQTSIVSGIRDCHCPCYAVWTSADSFAPEDEAILNERHQMMWKSPEYGPDRMAWRVYSIRMLPVVGRGAVDPDEIR